MKEKSQVKHSVMTKEIPNVISYRVYEISEELCSMEVYVMRYEDELRFYEEERTDYSIRAYAYTKNIDRFNRQMQEKCNIHGYDYPDDSGLGEINSFLADHYFVSVRKYEENVRAALERLNENARGYNEGYRARYLAERPNGITTQEEQQINGSLLNQAEKAIGDGISSVECINVGQANFSVGYDAAGKPKVVFDAGIQYYSKKFIRNKVNDVRTENGIVVISHYDFDHIMGYHHLINSGKERIWILPEGRKDPSTLERNLLADLDKAPDDHAVFLRNIDYDTVGFDRAKHTVQIGNMCIYRGNVNKKDNDQSTSENARCLMCEITGRKKALLPADSLYLEFPKGFSVDYLVVPHHSCNYTKPIPSGIMDLDRLETVVVFAGKHSGHHHPNVTHLDRLGFNWNDSRVIYLLKKPGLFDEMTPLTATMKIWKDSYTIRLY